MLVMGGRLSLFGGQASTEMVLMWLCWVVGMMGSWNPRTQSSLFDFLLALFLSLSVVRRAEVVCLQPR